MQQCQNDIRVVFARDPAAKNFWEVIFCYPGLHALWWHRVSHWWYRHNCFFIARLLSHWARFYTGIEIHPGAQIGNGVFIDHGGGVVIGETAIVGDNVTLYQGVTLGGTGKEKGKRHPTLEDYVVVACGAKVLGSFTVGEGAKIGAGSVVLKPVPPHSTVVGIPGQVISSLGISPLHIDNDEEEVDLDHSELPDPIKEKVTNLKEQVALLEERLAKLEENHASR
ncbi:MAG: serine O-acetyltransferase [Negativicoccus massiliensis]|nr:serine O-acetyltransferase [Negativicoccus succinicivorans]MBS5887632.1 serine O-acetyltransferase [Negativicoccus succinicivorans]MDU4642062.1 serine O-acetyltransferase [Negativicoccus massiliensis]MDU5027745.1 serine O-acetyltransferase [Negativicoccus succinicivorans]